jgi:uncharacterized alpha-E superfamily protein
MLSRVADSVYWMTRYIERAENVARFVDVNLHLMLDLPRDTEQQWEPLIRTTGDRELFEARYDTYSASNVIRFLSFDQNYVNSIYGCASEARENARSVREVISSEMWTQLNRFYLTVRTAAFGNIDVEYAPHEFFSQVKLAGHLFEGVMDATMSHGDAWHFGRLGRLLERADKTTRIIDMKYFILLPDVSYVGTPYDNIQWAALLQSASALEMYRKKYGRITPRRVVEFLLLDGEFPRAVRHCLRAAEESLRAITGTTPGTYVNRAEQSLGRLCAQLDFTSTDEILSIGVHEFLDRLQSELNEVGEAIFEAFFAIAPTPTEAVRRPIDDDEDADMQVQTQGA